MNYILRDIKLSKLTDTPMSDDTSKLIKFWNDLWCDMWVQIDAEKGEIRCLKNGHNYFIQEDKNDFMWCDFGRVWSFFRYELGLDYGETLGLIQHMMGDALNCRVNTPHFRFLIPD